jgi:hypothetical protein
MFKVNFFISLLVVGMHFQNVYADSALQKTQDCLRNQNCDPVKIDAGRLADQKALEAVGGNAGNKQELYNIGADIMPILVQQAGEDTTKMQAILFKAQTDPVSFLNSLPPEIQAEIKKVANAIEKNQAPGQMP